MEGGTLRLQGAPLAYNGAILCSYGRRLILMKIKDWLAFIALGLIWGSSFLWIKIAVGEIGPFLLVTLRIGFGILSLLLVVALYRPPWPRNRSLWLDLTFLGIINNALPYLLISWGEQYIDSAVAAILNSTSPLFTMLMAHVLLSDDRMSRNRLVGLLIGFLGIVILVSRDARDGLPGAAGLSTPGLIGQVAVLLAALSYAFSSVYARRVTREVAPILRALIPLLGADVIMWGATSLVEAPINLPQRPLTWLAVLWLGVMGVGVAYLLYFHLLHSVGPTRTLLVTYVFPLVGVLLGVIFLKESLDWNLGLGAGLVVGSIAMVNRHG